MNTFEKCLRWHTQVANFAFCSSCPVVQSVITWYILLLGVAGCDQVVAYCFDPNIILPFVLFQDTLGLDFLQSWLFSYLVSVM